MFISRYIDMDTDGFYKRFVLEAIGEKLSCRWMELGIYLGLEKIDLDSLKDQNLAVICAFEAFTCYWDRANPETRWDGLHFALKQNGRGDLNEYINKFIARYNIDLHKPDTKQLHILFLELSKQLPLDWRSVSIYLGVPNKDLDTIVSQAMTFRMENRAFKVLTIFKNSGKATPAKLHEALREMRRLDIIRYIDRLTGGII